MQFHLTKKSLMMRIIEEADSESPVETIMDTVDTEPGTLKVIETDGEAAVVETAFVWTGSRILP